MTPKRVKSRIGHFQKASDVSLLVTVEEKVGCRSIGVRAAAALQHPERHKGIEKIAGAASMQTQLRNELIGRQRTMAQFCEYTELYRAQQRLGCPKAESQLDDAFRGQRFCR